MLDRNVHHLFYNLLHTMQWTTCYFEIKLLVYEKAPNDKHHKINGKTVKIEL